MVIFNLPIDTDLVFSYILTDNHLTEDRYEPKNNV